MISRYWEAFAYTSELVEYVVHITGRPVALYNCFIEDRYVLMPTVGAGKLQQQPGNQQVHMIINIDGIGYYNCRL